MNNPLLAKQRPWCVGRLMFDRPAGSEIANQSYEFRGELIQTTSNVSEASFKQRVAARENDLRTKQRIDPGKKNSETGHSWLEKTFSPTSSSKVFIYRQFDTAATNLDYKTEAYLLSGGRLFSMADSIGSDFIGKVEDYYNDLLRRIESRDSWQIPKGAGFCIDGGIVTGASQYPEEASQSIALLSGRPALFVVKTRKSMAQDQGHPLTENMSNLRAQLDHMPGNYRILRQGKRQIAGMDAEEVLFELRDGAVTAFRFYLLAPGNPSTLAQPHTSIQLLLGAPPRDNLPPDQATSPVDEAGALQTWDALLNSLRLRPGAI